MIAYIIIPKNKVSTLLDGYNDFSVSGLNPWCVCYYSVDAFKSCKEDYCVCKFEFLSEEEVVEAINAARNGDFWDRYFIRWLEINIKNI